MYLYLLVKMHAPSALTWSLSVRIASRQKELRFSCVSFGWRIFYFKGESIMPNYKKMYFKMFNKVTDIIEELKELQIECEDMYIETYDESPQEDDEDDDT